MPYAFECRFVKATATAVLVEHLESGEEVWVPLSLVVELDAVEGKNGVISIRSWFARKLGIF